MIQGEEIFCFFVTILSWDYTKSLRWVGLRVSLLGLLWSMLLLLWSMLLTVAFYFVFWYETNELDAKVVLFFSVGAWDFMLVMEFVSSVILPNLFLFLAVWIGFSLLHYARIMKLWICLHLGGVCFWLNLWCMQWKG